MPTTSSLELKEGLHHEIHRLHTLACQNKQATYKDPATGSDVFTAFYLRERGSCCESSCRHCPWGFGKEELKTNNRKV